MSEEGKIRVRTTFYNCVSSNDKKHNQSVPLLSP